MSSIKNEQFYKLANDYVRITDKIWFLPLTMNNNYNLILILLNNDIV